MNNIFHHPYLLSAYVKVLSVKSYQFADPRNQRRCGIGEVRESIWQIYRFLCAIFVNAAKKYQVLGFHARTPLGINRVIVESPLYRSDVLAPFSGEVA
jgi:hypothetical protein